MTQEANPLLPNVIPLKLVLKLDPPLIGIIYKRNLKEQKKHIYQIFLQQLVEKDDPEQVLHIIYKEHYHYLKDIKKEQILKNITRILEQFQMQNMEEFLQGLSPEEQEKYMQQMQMMQDADEEGFDLDTGDDLDMDHY